MIVGFFSQNSFANDSYHPDDKSCIEFMEKKCSDIDLDYWENNCDLNFVGYNLVLDEKNRVIAAIEKSDLRESYKKNGYLVNVFAKIGCNHAAEYEVFYFKSNLTAADFSCKKVMETVKEIESAVFDHDGECIARYPEINAINNQCDIMYRSEVGDSKSSCRSYEAYSYRIKESDIVGYDLMIVSDVKPLNLL